MKNLYIFSKSLEKLASFLVPVLFVIGLFGSTSELLAQCTNTSAYGSAVAPTGTAVTTISTCSYQTEYSTITSVVAGNRYVVTNSAAGSFITIRYATSNGTAVAAGYSPLQFTAPCAGTYYAHWNTNAACGTATNCTTTAISCVSCGATNGNQCANTSAYGSATAPTTGTATFSTCSYAGEYSTLNSVVAGTVYSCSSNVSTDFITVRQGSASGPVIASGVGPLTWTSTVAGTYYCHWSANSSCGTANACRTTSVTYVGVGPCSGCTGTPNPGNTLASLAAVPVGGTTVLSMQNATGTGALYQWQSAPSSTGPWTNISGATAATYTLTFSTPTWYRCSVTCTVFNGTSTPLQIVQGPCVPTSAYGSGSGYYGVISNVTFNTLNHTSAGLAAPWFASYPTSTATTTVMAGTTQNLSVTSYYYDVVGVWFDWNNNMIYEASEYVTISPNSNGTGATWTGTASVFVPTNATIGTVSMRVRTEYYTYAFGSSSACSATTYGETKDYRFTIIPAPNCTGVPNASTVSTTLTTGCPGTPFTLSATGLSIGNGISYQWQSSPNGVNSWTNITGATSVNYVATTSTTLYYRIVTSCLYSASSNQSNVVSYVVAGNSCQCGAYPSSVPTYDYYNDITNVTVAGINNSSTCSTLAPGTGSVLNKYSNYTGFVGSGSLEQGQVANFSLTSTSCLYGAASNFFQIYIDFNQDGDFLDAGELCYYQPANAGGDQTLTGNFIVPPTASLGVTRMRIVNVNYGTAGTYNYATNAYYYGETEDYCITISIPPPCAGTPTPGNTIASPNSVFAGQTTVLTLQNAASGTGITYQWQSASSATGTWSNITGATSYTYTATPTAITWYRCIVTCTNGPSSGTSTPVQVMYNPYCNPAYVYGTQYGDLISSVVIPTTTLNNNSGTATTGPAYTYYSNIAAPTLQASTSYQLQVTAGSFSNQSFAAWIDYNDNFIFEASEKIGFSTTSTTTSFQMISFQINLACLPPLGVHRMRIRGVYATAGSTIDPCATYSYGETEDYNVNIVAGAPFSPSFTATPSASACTLTGYTYTTQAGMMSYTWGIPGTAGVDYNIVSGGTSTSNTVTLQWLSSGSKTVSINYLNASGCSSTGAVSTTVTVQSTVAITPITGIQSVCAGSQVTFATPTAGGTWSSSNSAVATIASLSGVVVGSTPGTATMTYTVPNPGTWCPASTATRTITVLPTPVLTTSSNVNLCAGSTTTL
ncbi:MAG: hypothetical protein RL207_1488, partial [Bacteroidota bacterium]